MTQKNNLYPGYCIVQEPGSLIQQAHKIFNNRNNEAIDLFLKINSDTPYLKRGQIVIVADPRNPNQNNELNQLKYAKKKVDIVLANQVNSVTDFFA